MNILWRHKILLAGAMALICSATMAGTVQNEWFSLQGNPVESGNPVGEDGHIRRYKAPVLRVTRTTDATPQGTVLLFPGGAYRILSAVNEGSLTAKQLNGFGYDVVTLEYHVGESRPRDLALEDARAAWKLLKSHPEVLGIHASRCVVMGYSAGGHLAAGLVQQLKPEVQPDDLVLVYPAYLEETDRNSAEPKVQPPVHPSSRLFIIMGSNDKSNWLGGAHAYEDAWLEAGGYAVFQEFKEVGHGFGMKSDLAGDLAQWPDILNYFLENGPKPGAGPFNTHLPWFLKNNQGRLATFRKEQSKDMGAIVFLGDSITRKWDLARAFPHLKTANRGISGDTTRGMLCRFKENVLDLQPQAIVFMGGINDLSSQPQGTPESIASNVRDMLIQIHAVTPNTPVLVCETLPSNGTSLGTVRAINAAMDRVIADFSNAYRVKTFDPFLNEDGTINLSLFRDGTHPNDAGYAVWQKQLEPQLEKYAGSND